MAMMAACNLTLDLDDYPYEAAQDAVDSVSDVDADGDIRDAADIDARDEARPILIFTELMPDSSTDGTSSVEYGEFFEIKNVGQAPADPRNIFIKLEDGDREIAIDTIVFDEREQAILDELKPIAPGDYFVFVRQDDDYYRITADLAPGTFYEYGRWNDQVPLSNRERSLTLIYKVNGEDPTVTDRVEWISGSLIDPSLVTNTTRSMREDVSIGVQAISESQADNNSPTNWCYHVNPLSGSPVRASPGRPTPADCTFE